MMIEDVAVHIPHSTSAASGNEDWRSLWVPLAQRTAGIGPAPSEISDDLFDCFPFFFSQSARKELRCLVF